MAAANRYRRRIITFATEMEGFIPSLGDLIAITHDMPAWGQAYGVLSYDASSRTSDVGRRSAVARRQNALRWAAQERRQC